MDAVDKFLKVQGRSNWVQVEFLGLQLAKYPRNKVRLWEATGMAVDEAQGGTLLVCAANNKIE